MPTTLSPINSASGPCTSPKGITSARTPLSPTTIAPSPMRTNWRTAACPPNTTKSPIVTWPPSTTLLAKVTSLPTLQSWPTCDPTISQQRSPTSVTPRSSSVPVFTVTPSRISQSAPITSRVGPPRYLTDCGGVPSEANG